MKEKSYNAIFFKQPGNKKYIMATFVVGIKDLIQWVGFPNKKYTETQKILFQRPIDDSRLEKIKSHFENCITPNSLLITLKEDHVSNLSDIIENLKDTDGPLVGELKIKYDEIEFENTEAIDLVIKSLEIRLANDNIDNIDDKINDDNIIETVSNELEDMQEDLEIESGLDEDLSFDYKSHLKETLAYLQLVKKKIEENDKLVSDEEINAVSSFCEDYLKPAFLVDGQHRTKGAYEKIIEENSNGNKNYDILMPVSAIINADWKESVFQFVIINQTAKKIDSRFLSSIISTSLTDEELQSFREQFDKSGASVTEALNINKLNNTIVEMGNENINPFYNNVEHKVPHESEEALKYSTVASIVKRCRNFKGGTSVAFGNPYDTFKDIVINEFNISIEDWKEKFWLQFLIYFWYLVEHHFTSEKKLVYSPLKVDKNGNRKKGTNLSLKVSMLYLQDHFINFINTSYQFLKNMENHTIEIIGDKINYDNFKNIFNQWCQQHKKNYEFFEEQWKGLSRFRREYEKYEAIHAAFGTKYHKKTNLFRG